MNNTVKRSLSGVCFLAIVLAGLLFNKFLYAALFVFMLVGMMVEFFNMTMGKSYPVSQVVAIVTGVFLFSLVFFSRAGYIPGRFIALAIVPLIVLMALSLYAADKSEFSKFSNLYTGLVYIALPLTLSNFIVFNRQGEFSGIMMLSFFCIIWASDIGAYCFGLLFGKNGRKLFPSVSPKKSWAGFWGGFIMAIAVGIVLGLTGMLDFPLVHCAVLAALMDVAGVYGDLFESQWKRVHDIKDSGNIIPGHGGLLDRFDSTIFAIPIGTIYLLIAGLL